ncbi:MULTISPECIES: hypothetical protein [Gluconobacter]|uniref:hypothetical protein n=1 Tax=Gluconobacter TaxID=441 RepID=UPI0039ED7CA0
MLVSSLYWGRYNDTLSLLIKLGLKCAGTSYFLLLLSGCAGAHLKDVKELADTQPVAPLAIMVTSNVPENSKNKKRLVVNVHAISDGL